MCSHHTHLSSSDLHQPDGVFSVVILMSVVLALHSSPRDWPKSRCSQAICVPTRWDARVRWRRGDQGPFEGRVPWKSRRAVWSLWMSDTASLLRFKLSLSGSHVRLSRHATRSKGCARKRARAWYSGQA